MKKFYYGVWILGFLIAFVLLAMPGEASTFAGGDGSTGNPYKIETAEQLAIVAEAVYLDKHFILTADIDLFDYLSEGGGGYNDGAGWEPIGTSDNPFTGSFDGGEEGFTITGLFINQPEENYMGLFGYLGQDAEIRNLRLVNVNVTGQDYVGGLVGFNYNGTITNSYVTGMVNGYDSTGGLTGQNSGTITGCYAAADVTGSGDVGGLVGSNFSSVIEDSYATGAVYGVNCIGGLVGFNYSTGSITGSYATGTVDGDSYFGGLVGWNDVGDLTYSYYDSETTGQEDTGKGEPKSTIQMQTPTTFTGWDFSELWGINPDQNGGYPFLRWQAEYTDAQFAGGAGNSDNPYEVATPWQLNNVRLYLDKHFILTAEINLGVAPYNDGAGWEPIGTSYSSPFTGSFDGGEEGYTISNLYINRPDTGYVGLFGYVDGASIQNVRLLDVDVNGGTCVGSLVGLMVDTAITDSYATGHVVGTEEDAGGLVGTNYGTITNSYATSSVDGDFYVGGLVGYNEGTIENSYAVGAVNGNIYVGGLVGRNYPPGSIATSYAAGDVTGGSFVGGLVGDNSGAVTASFWDTQTSGRELSSGGTGKTTAEMKLLDTFTGAGWNFDNIWSIDVGTYPYLAWQTKLYDFAPPVFTDGYPQAGNITHNVLDLLLEVDEYATAYFVVLPDGAIAPTAAQIRAGTSADDEVLDANSKGSIGLTAFTEGTASITGLEPGTTYYIYVVAEDGAFNLQPNVSTVQETTAAAPTANVNFVLTTPDSALDGNDIAVNQSIPKSVDVNTVNGTESVVITATKTAAQSMVVSGDDVTVAGTATQPTFTVNTAGIAAGGIYEFTLTVSEAGKAEIIYDVTVTVALPDTTPPVVGGEGNITVSNVTHNSLDLNWSAATDDVTAPQDLQYKVLRSASDNIITVNNAEANGTIVRDWAADLTSVQASGLSAGTTYYFNVIVRDEAGNKAVYNTTSKATAAAPIGGGGGGGAAPPPQLTQTSVVISAVIGGIVSLGDVSVEIPAGTLPANATFSIKKLTSGEADSIVPEGLRLKLGSEVYEITTTGIREFGDNTITIKIPYDPDKIAAGEVPVTNYYNEENGEWTALETTVEQGPGGLWCAVVKVNHLTKFAVFSREPQNVIKLTIGSIEASIDDEPYVLDAVPFIKPGVSRTLVPLRFISEALGAQVEWRADKQEVVIREVRDEQQMEIILTIGSEQVLVNSDPVTIDCPAELHHPGRTFVPLRFVSETLGAQVQWNADTNTITITR